MSKHRSCTGWKPSQVQSRIWWQLLSEPWVVSRSSRLKMSHHGHETWYGSIWNQQIDIRRNTNRKLRKPRNWRSMSRQTSQSRQFHTKAIFPWSEKSQDKSRNKKMLPPSRLCKDHRRFDRMHWRLREYGLTEWTMIENTLSTLMDRRSREDRRSTLECSPTEMSH